MTPTARSLEKLRNEKWKPYVVETFNHFTKRRKDLFGFADILALKDKEILAVQATSYSNISSRVRKIEDAEDVGDVRKAGIRIEVWGWRKDPKKRKWVCRIVDLS